MEQIRALNALAPFLALAKSATSPRAAADLVTQATSAQNTYVFAELLGHPNVQALASDKQYAGHLELLKVFAYGTCESYHATSNLPALNDAQTTKLRLLSLLTIAAQKPTTTTTTSRPSNLSYTTLCTRLSLPTAIDLEHLVTQATYSDLLTATLNPAAQTVVITSVAPLRDLAPGSVADMIAELAAWSGRCETVLAELEAEVVKVKADARRRNLREMKAERQVKAVTEAGEKGKDGGFGGNGNGNGNGNRMGRAGIAGRKIGGEVEEEEDGDAMDLDAGWGGAGEKKKKGGGAAAAAGVMGRSEGGAGRSLR
ncbi:hypothetical protein LTR62_003068 [Meristemomyces frigidus]|uniref:PCI domain-containing protein n=1 Tax=Meristemomyces frigidus TaxID=1508187 RepID=A0AAN7TGH6_9PEZI|nr:hypothetical protein LTR62_003068 [Meristemomyces frigidus]